MAHHRHKRKLSNYLLKPGFQLRYGLYLFIFGFAGTTLIQYLSYLSLRRAIIDFHTKNEKADLMSWMDPSVLEIGYDYYIFIGLFALGCAVFGIWMTHRVVGPEVAIKRFVGEMRRGKFGHKLTLREKDQLFEIAQELNDLSESLATRLNERQPQLEVIESRSPEQIDENESSQKTA